jgi:rod shape-determining protein MreC
VAVLDIRQRTGWLLLAVIVGHVLLISAQVSTERGVPVLEQVTFGLFAELQRGASTAVRAVRDGWGNYLALQEVRAENAYLQQQLAVARLGLQQERALAGQSRTLQALLDMRAQLEVSTTAAAVIGGSVSPEFQTVTIDKGTGDGLQADMAVLSPDGVVGRVITPTARASKVQLLVDRDAAAGAVVERTRAQGIVVGLGTESLRLDHVQGTADIRVGDRVLTSGIEGIYPRGFLLGQIQSFEREGGEFVRVMVGPLVDFSSLETVLVVLTPPALGAQ